MKRVLIIGSCGAGKSTLARRIHQSTGLELIHLDKFYHKPNWTEPSEEEWVETVEDLVSKDEWIVDGNYGGTMDLRLAKCDTVVWLDYPRITCMWRVLKRIVRYRNDVRPDMAEGCKERFDWEFIKYVWHFPRDKAPNLERRLRTFDNDRIFRLTTNREVQCFLSNLPR